MSTKAHDRGAGDPAGLLARMSAAGSRLTAGALKELVLASNQVPDLVGLHGGMLPERLFPLAGLQLAAAAGGGAARAVPVSTTQLAAGQQQYSMSTSGYPPLLAWVQAHVAALHAPPAGHACVITDGSTHGLEMLCGLFLDPQDSILTEEFTYPQALDCNLLPRGCRMLTVPLDHQGILPLVLDELLAGLRQRGERMPKFLYTVPTGHNPTGATATLERKRAVYELCSRYDLIIVEDDAYFYLQFPSGAAGPQPGLAGLPRGESYLSLDVDGRVIRLDTFSKFLAPGLRLGWACAAPAVVAKLAQAMAAQCLGASGVCQALTAQLLESWGPAGLETHLQAIQANYAAQCAALAAAAERELGGLAEWWVPRAGMFLWARLLGVADAQELLPAMYEAAVAVVPGRLASPRAADPDFKCPYVRISFSHLPPQRLEEGVRRLASVLRRHAQQRAAAASGGGGSGGGDVADA